MKERLAALAQATERSQAYLANRAIEEFVAVQEWQIHAIHQGLEAADHGEFVSEEQLRDTFTQWGMTPDPR